MKITKVRIRRLTGTMVTEGPMWEERLVRLVGDSDRKSVV